MKKKNKLIIIFIACLFVAIYSIQKIVQNKRLQNEGVELYESIRAIAIEEQGYINHALLSEINSDYVAWLNITDSSISYPVVQTTNNNFYLTHGFDKNYLIAGSIFIDCYAAGNFSNRNTVIYGHQMPDETMFSELRYFMNDEFCETHQEVILYTENEVLTYAIFSVYRIDAVEDYFISVIEQQNITDEWIEDKILNSRYEFSINVDITSAQVITLITCTENGNETDRYVVHAVLF